MRRLLSFAVAVIVDALTVGLVTVPAGHHQFGKEQLPERPGTSLVWLSQSNRGGLPESIAARPTPDSSTMTRLRSSHPYIRAIISEAQVRSATFRRLVRVIEKSDGIVYIEEGACGHGVHACLPPLVTLAGGFRILRVLIDARREDWEVMSNIAHELQHAIEVLQEPSARTDTQVFFLFYQNYTGSTEPFETTEAQRAGDAVRKEVASFARGDSTMGLSRKEY